MAFESATPRRMTFFEKIRSWLVLNPVVVFTPGKVGSSTVVQSLRAIGIPEVQPHSLRYSIPGVYFVKPDFTGVQKIRSTFKTMLLRLKTALFKLSRCGRPIKVVAMVRSPVDRNISAFFEHFHHLGLGSILDHSPQALADYYFRFGYHDAQEQWLKRELQAVWGFDAYGLEFSPGQRYTTAQRKNVGLFFVRMEDLDTSYPALREWLGVERLEVLPANRSEYKEYADLYKAAKAIIKADKAYIDKVESTDFYRTFYGNAEVAK